MISVVSYKTISFLLIKLNHIAYNIFIYCMIVRELWRFIPPWKCQFSDIKGFKTIFNRIIFKFTWYAHPLDFSSAWNKISIHIHPAICNIVKTVLTNFVVSLRKGIRAHVSINKIKSIHNFHSFCLNSE